jgi:glyoxylase-like metal-dependent hydrolase (beta-lactamase superfamily II)/rhodanese-related sulfurtransferase
MNVTTFVTPGLGDSTYLFEHDGIGVLVDPQRDIDRFVEAAADLDMRFVLETHLHNDYVSGGRSAARATGGQLVLPASSGAAFDSLPAFHLEDLDAGSFTLRPIHTPGHTPEHVSYLILVDAEPVALFSGGSLLVGSAGRSDLLGMDRAESLARLQYGSVTRLAELPRDVALYPTHGAGSFCTSSVAESASSTVGREVRSNPVLAHTTAASFVADALTGLQPYPDYYAHMGPLNLTGPEPMPAGSAPTIAVGDVPSDAHVIDIRPQADYAAGHLPGSYGLELEDQMGVWAGWLVPFDEPIVLVANPNQDIAAATVQLARIGYDRVVGIINDLEGRDDLATYRLASVADLKNELLTGSPQVLDVRAPGDWEELSIPGSFHRYVPDLRFGLPEELEPEHPVWIICGGGYRSQMAVRYLEAGSLEPIVVTGGGVAEILAGDQT